MKSRHIWILGLLLFFLILIAAILVADRRWKTPLPAVTLTLTQKPISPEDLPAQTPVRTPDDPHFFTALDLPFKVIGVDLFTISREVVDPGCFVIAAATDIPYSGQVRDDTTRLPVQFKDAAQVKQLRALDYSR